VFGPSDAEPGYTQGNAYVASNNGNSTPANSLSNPFPQGIIQPTGNTLGPLTAIGSTFSYLDANKSGGGTVYQYSADLQRELWGGIVLEAGYICPSINSTPITSRWGRRRSTRRRPTRFTDSRERRE
jgi:hypothetical protein